MNARWFALGALATVGLVAVSTAAWWLFFALMERVCT